MADPRLRQFTIKTGVMKRLTKERLVCEKEIQQEKERLEKFKDNDSDSHVLNKQEEVIQECIMMLPDSIRRLKKEFELLEKLVNDEQDLKESKEYETALTVLNEAKEVLAKSPVAE